MEDGQSIKAEFYSAKQLPNENIVSWSCRIEEMIDRALDQGEVQESEMDEMLRVRFWHGLQENLRDKSRHKYDQLQTFDELHVRTALRQIELEYNQAHGFDLSKHGKQQSQTCMISKTDPKLEKAIKDLTGAVKGMCNKLEVLEKEYPLKKSVESNADSLLNSNPNVQVQNTGQQTNSCQPVTYDTLAQSGEAPRFPVVPSGQQLYSVPQYNQTLYNIPQSMQSRPVSHGDPPPNLYPSSTQYMNTPTTNWGIPISERAPYRNPLQGTQTAYRYAARGSGYFETDPRARTMPQCWTCGQYGHIRRQCTACTDFMRPSLNYQGPPFGSRR